MTRGLARRTHRDHRRYDYFRTFKPKLGGYIPDFVLPLYANPNQNEPDAYWPRPALFQGCTGFAQAHIAEADLKAPVDPAFIYQNTAIISGRPGQPQTLEDSFRAATVYGVKKKGQTDAEALTQRMAPYFEVIPQKGQDWYDAILEAVYTNQRPVSVGTTWPTFFEDVEADGMQYYVPRSWVGGHDHCFIGQKEGRLVDISWNGPHWGDRGLSYFTREQVNAMMAIQGSDALTSRILQGEEVKRVWVNMLLQLQILTLLVSLYQRLKATVGSWRNSLLPSSVS